MPPPAPVPRVRPLGRPGAGGRSKAQGRPRGDCHPPPPCPRRARPYGRRRRPGPSAPAPATALLAKRPRPRPPDATSAAPRRRRARGRPRRAHGRARRAAHELALRDVSQWQRAPDAAGARALRAAPSAPSAARSTPSPRSCRWPRTATSRSPGPHRRRAGRRLRRDVRAGRAAHGRPHGRGARALCAERRPHVAPARADAAAARRAVARRAFHEAQLASGNVPAPPQHQRLLRHGALRGGAPRAPPGGRHRRHARAHIHGLWSRGCASAIARSRRSPAGAAAVAARRAQRGRGGGAPAAAALPGAFLDEPPSRAPTLMQRIGRPELRRTSCATSPRSSTSAAGRRGVFPRPQPARARAAAARRRRRPAGRGPRQKICSSSTGCSTPHLLGQAQQGPVALGELALTRRSAGAARLPHLARAPRRGGLRRRARDRAPPRRGVQQPLPDCALLVAAPTGPGGGSPSAGLLGAPAVVPHRHARHGVAAAAGSTRGPPRCASSPSWRGSSPRAPSPRAASPCARRAPSSRATRPRATSRARSRASCAARTRLPLVPLQADPAEQRVDVAPAAQRLARGPPLDALFQLHPGVEDAALLADRARAHGLRAFGAVASSRAPAASAAAAAVVYCADTVLPVLPSASAATRRSAGQPPHPLAEMLAAIPRARPGPHATAARPRRGAQRRPGLEAALRELDRRDLRHLQAAHAGGGRMASRQILSPTPARSSRALGGLPTPDRG